MGELDRREFLRMGTAALLGLAAGPAAAEPEPPRVRRRVPLGRTGLELPDVGFGSSRLAGDDDLVRHALGRGITYFDTAETYMDGAAEETLGRALQGRREEVVLATKVLTRPDTKRGELMRALEGSLRRLRTDRVEVYFNHAVNDVAQLRNDEWYAFAERARREGKIRFVGMSGHGGRLVECLDHALEHGLVDVVLVAHNFGQDPAFFERFTKGMDFVAVQPELPRALRKAREKGVGVVAMKTLRGGRLNDMRPYETPGGTFAQAALRWVLASGLADALVVTMESKPAVDEYLGASGWTRLAGGDFGLLARYEARHGATQCRYGCASCESACPASAPIPDLLRARMYAEDYGDLALARRALAEAGPRAAACLSCAGQPCLGACPHGLPVAELALRAARLIG
jgi:predicted aldo/keto reductase-like oxidoreductase